MICVECGAKEAEAGTDTCFRCRVSSIGFAFCGGALRGHSGFHRTKREYMEEHFGSADDRELAKKGIERAT